MDRDRSLPKGILGHRDLVLMQESVVKEDRRASMRIPVIKSFPLTDSVVVPVELVQGTLEQGDGGLVVLARPV